MTQQQAAKAIGCSRSTVAMWESPGGIQGIEEYLTSASKVYRVRPEWLQLTSDEDGYPWGGEDPASITANETDSSYLRIEQLDAEGDMGAGAINADYPEVVRSMDFEESYIRSLIGFVPRRGRLKLMTGRGDSMDPVIRPGDVVVVDTGCQTFEGDGLYLINSGNGQQIKALQDRGDAVYVVSANSTVYPPFPVPHGTLIGGKVYLRNRLDRMN